MARLLRRLGFLALKAGLSLAFLTLGTIKLIGLEPTLGTFAAIGWGDWFRYATGLIEVAGALLIWAPKHQPLGAALLLATCIGAVIAHIFVLGPMMQPAVGLGILSAFVLYVHSKRFRP